MSIALLRFIEARLIVAYRSTDEATGTPIGVVEDTAGYGDGSGFGDGDGSGYGDGAGYGDAAGSGRGNPRP